MMLSACVFDLMAFRLDLGVGAAFPSVCGFAGLRFETTLGWALRCARIYVLVLAAFCAVCCRWRPYRVECTGFLSTSDVKRRRARLVLGWGAAREDLRVLQAFAFGRASFDRFVPAPCRIGGLRGSWLCFRLLA